jgi:hypothetical protein
VPSLTLPRLPVPRLAVAAAALGLIAASIAAASDAGAWWALAIGLIAPDLALLAGGGRDLAHGQLHPRAVPAYNAVHRFWGPLAMVAAGAIAGGAWLVLGLAWLAHVTVDRAAGYGLRDERGFQRGG